MRTHFGLWRVYFRFLITNTRLFVVRFLPLGSYKMASTSKNYRYSISEIELNLTHSQERLASDSRLSTHAPLLEKASELPQSWPTSPRSVKLSSGTAIWNILVDITLLAFSAAFLIFALFVILYDGKPTSSHPQTAERFYQASHLVSTCAGNLPCPSAH
jgi:hypothetical protein